MSSCPNCETENLDGTLNCNKCGHILPLIGLNGVSTIPSGKAAPENENNLIKIISSKITYIFKLIWFVFKIFILILIAFTIFGYIYGIFTQNQSTNNKTQITIKSESKPTIYPTASTNTATTCDEKNTLSKASKCTVIINGDYKYGTGFSVNDGFLVTNKHVIADSTNLWTEIDGIKYPLQVWNYSDTVDVAVLKLPSSIPTCEWADISKFQPGDNVYALGWGGGDPTGVVPISKGIYSRPVTLGGISYIQTDAAINHGNSGGPLINQCGVVGINTSRQEIDTSNNLIQGISFALKGDSIQPIIQSLIQTGNIRIIPKLNTFDLSMDTLEALYKYYLANNTIASVRSPLQDFINSEISALQLKNQKYSEGNNIINKYTNDSNEIVSLSTRGVIGGANTIISANTKILGYLKKIDANNLNSMQNLNSEVENYSIEVQNGLDLILQSTSIIIYLYSDRPSIEYPTGPIPYVISPTDRTKILEKINILFGNDLMKYPKGYNSAIGDYDRILRAVYQIKKGIAPNTYEEASEW